MKTSMLALNFSLLIASGMCDYELNDAPGGATKGVGKHLRKRDNFLWNPDNTASCTDHSQCLGFCGVIEDGCVKSNPNTTGCSKANICMCYSTYLPPLCECEFHKKTIDTCERGGSALDAGDNYRAYCVSKCDPLNDNGGNGKCTHKQDPCLEG